MTMAPAREALNLETTGTRESLAPGGDLSAAVGALTVEADVSLASGTHTSELAAGSYEGKPPTVDMGGTEAPHRPAAPAFYCETAWNMSGQAPAAEQAVADIANDEKYGYHMSVETVGRLGRRVFRPADTLWYLAKHRAGEVNTAGILKRSPYNQQTLED